MESTASTDVLDANIRGHSDPRCYRIAGCARSQAAAGCAPDKARPDRARPRYTHSRKWRIILSSADAGFRRNAILLVFVSLLRQSHFSRK